MDSEERSKKSVIGLIILAGASFILLTLFVIFLLLRLKKKQSQDQKKADDAGLKPFETSEFIEIVRSTLTIDELNSKIITAHAMHETGIFTSRVFIQDKNAFGMKHPNIRNTTSQGADISGYAIYDSLKDSIKDLDLWFGFYEKEINFDSVDSYVQFLKDKGYFTASFIKFNSAVKKHFNTL